MREFLWQVLPASPAPQNPQNPFQHTTVLNPGTTTLALFGRLGEQGRDLLPLRFGQQRTRSGHRPSLGAADSAYLSFQKIQLPSFQDAVSGYATASRLFPDLEGTDAGIRLINTMADALVQQSTFPDLEGWEDSDFKKEQARKAVSALKEFLKEQKDAAATERERAASRTRASKIQAEAQKRQMSLDKFSERLAELSTRLGTQQAGYDFQDWFYDLAEFFEVIARRPYISGGRQIDGSVSVDGTTYLVELKFTAEQADATGIDTFHRKVTSKADNTMGIFLSISGFSSVAIEGASGPKTPLLLFDHSHVYRLLGGESISSN
jgi:hypothetical protein